MSTECKPTDVVCERSEATRAVEEFTKKLEEAKKLLEGMDARMAARMTARIADAVDKAKDYTREDLRKATAARDEIFARLDKERNAAEDRHAAFLKLNEKFRVDKDRRD